jgi:glutathione synthase
MHKLKILFLTDHLNHGPSNSLYTLVQAMRLHTHCHQVDVATRGNTMNDSFFKNDHPSDLYVTRTDQDFAFSPTGKSFEKYTLGSSLNTYDVVWLRLPPPLSDSFLNILSQRFSNQLIINSPKGIQITGSKEFLINFRELCPPLKICTSIEDIKTFKNRFPIVLKPFREYGGKGIVRIDGNKVWEGKRETTFDNFIEKIKHSPIEYLGVKYLKNVTQGDKRIVVVNGKILGASLRLPAKDSWICNIAMGGSALDATPDEAEVKIVEHLNPALAKLGIVMYGVDTLINDEGKRVLSEINTTSIGGFANISKLSNKLPAKEAADLIWNYIIEKTKKSNVIRS